MALTSTTGKATAFPSAARDGSLKEECTADSCSLEGKQPALVGSTNLASGKHLEPG